MAVQNWETEWTAQEKLALAVVQQACWDVQKGKEGMISDTASQGRIYPLPIDVEDAADFLTVRFWQRDNLWRQALEPYLSGPEAKAQLRRVVACG